MNIFQRTAALAATGALAASLTVSAAGPASAAPDDTSAGWTSRQLTNGVVVFPQYGDFADYGMTTDAALALKAIGGHADDLAAIRSALADNADSWTAPGGVVNGGSTAKAVVAAQVTGAEPRSFGGVDLVERLEGQVSTTAPIVGRLEDQGANDYANVYSQAVATRGLALAGSDRTGDAAAFLLKQQCKAGYFRLYFNADKAAPKQGCDAGDPADSSAPDTDATAIAVISLAAIPKADRTPAMKTARADAVAWLKRTQKDNGSFGGGPSTEGSNTDSTGLAGWALGLSGSCTRAREAATWVKALQVRGDVSGTPLAGEKGAIAYNRKAYRKAADAGITDGSQYQWRKATFDAAPSLRYLTCR